MRDERLDYSYRNFSSKPIFEVSRRQMTRSLRQLFFHYGRWFDGATDDVAKMAAEIYITRYGDTPVSDRA